MSNDISNTADGGKSGTLNECEDVDNSPNSLAPGSAYRKKVERRLVWKLDLKMSLLVVIYILNYIDRNNASAAR